MKRVAIFVIVGLVAIAIRWSFVPAHSAETGPGDADGAANRAFTLFLPVISQGGASSPTVVPTLTPTLISTAPTAAPSLTPTATGTAPLATPTIAATATATSTPTPSQTPTQTPPQTPTATNTATSTATATPTATNTATSTPPASATATRTPTAQPTSINFPDVTFSCPQEPALNNSVWLYLTVTITEPAPSAASFFFEPTEFRGPVNEIVKPLSALTNIFSNETTARSPGRLAKCGSTGQCTAVYTLTETEVTRYIGTTVDCHF